MAEEKQVFRFANRQAVPAPEHRIANALEYIAHYLDRIEGHLERLVSVTDANGAGFVMVQKELSNIRGAVQAVAEKD